MDDSLSELDLADWCTKHLGAAPTETLWTTGHLAHVVALRLADGREVVVKARPEPPGRVRACLHVQQALADAGFPCPRPLTGPEPLAGLTAHAETHLPGGTALPRGPAATTAMAVELARLITVTSALPAATRDQVSAALTPPPVWAWPQHDHGPIWPDPDDRDTDLHTLTEPAWLNDLGARIRTHLHHPAGTLVIAHADWEKQNMRWTEATDPPRLHAVHDWDSLAVQPEPLIVGLAAAMHTADGHPHSEATIAETDAFLTAYTTARGHPFSTAETHTAWAAGLWVRTFNTRKDTLDPDGGTTALARLAAEAPERLRRAGA